MTKPSLRLDQDDFFYQDVAIPVIDNIIVFLKSASGPSKKVFHYVIIWTKSFMNIVILIKHHTGA